MAEKRRALGRGLGALIPSAPSGGANRPVDVFFTEQKNGQGGGTSTLTEDAPRPGGAAGAHDGDAHSRADQSAGVSVDGARSAAAGTAGTANAAPPAPSDEISGEGAGPALAPVPGAEFAELPVDSIRPNPKQPRTVFDEDQLAELVHSIREIGVLQPVVVRRIPEAERASAEGRQFELIMGERRWRATREAGLAVIPAIIKDTHDDDLLRDALLENLHRSQLNPLEEAAAYQQLLDDFGCSHEELATRIGRSRPQISNTLRLLKLPPLVQRRVAAGVLSAGHARALLGLSDGAAMERMAQRIVAEGLSVRTVERQHRPGSAQGQDHRGVRLHRGPAAHHGAHGHRGAALRPVGAPAAPDRPTTSPGRDLR